MWFLHVEMGLNLKVQKDVPINLTKDDINMYMKNTGFSRFDRFAQTLPIAYRFASHVVDPYYCGRV